MENVITIEVTVHRKGKWDLRVELALELEEGNENNIEKITFNQLKSEQEIIQLNWLGQKNLTEKTYECIQDR